MRLRALSLAVDRWRDALRLTTEVLTAEPSIGLIALYTCFAVE